MTTRFFKMFAIFCFIIGWGSGDTKALAPSAEIGGLIQGPREVGLQGARIVIRNKETGKELVAVSGSRGLYRAAGLPAGEYDIQAEIQGFESASEPGIHLSEGESRRVNLTLAIATIREIITVVAVAPRDTLEAPEARESSARDVGEALARTCGITKIRKGGIANDIVLRGFQARDLNVLVDGQRVYGACPNRMDPPAFHVDFAEVDRIEIGKGPFDIKNNGSLGGVVNIVTRKPEPGLHATANLSTGSYGYLNPSGTGSYANHGFSVLGGYSYRLSEPYTDGSGRRFTEYTNYQTNFLDSDAFRIGTAWGRLSAVPRKNHLTEISYTRQAANHMLYPYLQMDALYDDMDRFSFGYQIENLSNTLRSIRVQSYYSQVRHWMTDDFRTSALNTPRGYSMGTFAKTGALGGHAEGSFQNLTIGMEAFDRGWSSTTQMAGMGYMTQYSIPDVSSISAGVYADYRKPLTDKLKLGVNARIDRVHSEADSLKANTNLYYAYNSTRTTSATDTYPSGSVHATYSLPIGLELSGGAGSTVRVPDALERYLALRRSGSDWVGNPELSPSRNIGFDSSLSFRRQGLLVTSNFYYNRVENYIAVRRAGKVNAVTGIMNSSARSYENVNALLYGSELQVAYTITRRIFVSTSMQQVRGSKDPKPEMGILSRNLAEMPPMSSRSTLRFDTGRLWAEIEGIFAGAQRRVDTDLREEATAGYGLANLRAGITFKRYALRLGLNNLFDRQFYEPLSYQRDPFRYGVRVYEPGRNVYFNLACRF